MSDHHDIAEELNPSAIDEPASEVAGGLTDEAVVEPVLDEAEAPKVEPEPGVSDDEPSDGTAADAVLVEAVDGGLTWVPYAVYLGAWIALSGLSAYLLDSATPEQPARWLPVYAPLVFAGLALAVLGPLLSLAVWLVARSRRSADRRRGLLASALTRGALAAFFGAMVWIVTLYMLEVLTGSGVW
ncbi:MAG: hypothetical protein U1E08_05915 [Coriobacteriia bacterium]|nr:hypothetical protein [Actinomycetota bacterium]MDZ4167211.1 hypothetical protein [Coriobacteriia bacterium]